MAVHPRSVQSAILRRWAKRREQTADMGAADMVKLLSDRGWRDWGSGTTYKTSGRRVSNAASTKSSAAALRRGEKEIQALTDGPRRPREVEFDKGVRTARQSDGRRMDELRRSWHSQAVQVGEDSREPGDRGIG